MNYREVFFAANGFGPYTCYFCAEPITKKLYVHHIDEDGDNDDVHNLTAAHGRCHIRHHMQDPARRAKYAASTKRMWKDPTYRRRTMEGMKSRSIVGGSSASALRGWETRRKNAAHGT